MNTLWISFPKWKAEHNKWKVEHNLIWAASWQNQQNDLWAQQRLRSFGLGLVWFLFYGPSTHFRSFRARSVSLTTLFLGKPSKQFTST